MEKKRTRLITMIATVMIAMVFIVSGVAVRSFVSDDNINSLSPKSEQTTTSENRFRLGRQQRYKLVRLFV